MEFPKPLNLDNEVRHRVERLAASSIALQLEQWLREALAVYLQHFANYGVDLVGVISIEQRRAPDSPIAQFVSQARFEAFANHYKGNKDPEIKLAVGQAIKDALASTLLCGKGH